MTLVQGTVLQDTDSWDRESDVAHPDEMEEIRLQNWVTAFEYRRAS